MAGLILAGTTSGSVTLDPPASAGSTVITLPATSGTMALAGGAGSFTTLDASGVATFSAGSATAPAITTTGDTNTGVFFPAADTVSIATNGVERIRSNSTRGYFSNSGSIATVADCVFNFAGTFAGNRGISINATDSATGMDAMWFATQGTQRGSIVCSTGGTAYNSVSDYRLKENVVPITGALTTVELLKPVTYTWKADGTSNDGFIAHELQAVCPQAVTGDKDAVDAEGNPIYQGIDTSFLVATLTAAIQELNAKFEEYKASHP